MHSKKLGLQLLFLQKFTNKGKRENLFKKKNLIFKALRHLPVWKVQLGFEACIRWKHPTQGRVCCGCVDRLFLCSSTATALAEAVCLAVHQSIHTRTTPPLVTSAKPCGYLLLNSVQQPLTPIVHVPLSSISTSYAELCGNTLNYGL